MAVNPNPPNPYAQQYESFEQFLQTPYGKQWMAAQMEAAGWNREQLRRNLEWARYQYNTMSAQQKAQMGLSREQMGLSRDELALRQETERGNLALGQERLGLERELGTGRLGLERELGTGRLGLETEMGRGRLGLDTELGRGRLANETLAQEIQYRAQPESWIDLARWREGQAPGGVLASVQRLANGVQGPAFGAPGAGPYDPSTGGLAAPAPAPGGLPADPRAAGATALVEANPPSAEPGLNPGDAATLGAIRNLYARGGHGIRYSDWLATPSVDRRIVLGAIKSSRGDPAGFEDEIRRGRIGQGGGGSYGAGAY